jgi:hypothetical protein
VNAVITKIRQRGYWEVTLHPGAFVERRIAKLGELRKIIEDLSVRFRGWDFPHIDREGPILGTDWIESSVDWSNYVEYWRAYQSGQFIYIGGIRTDWYDQSIFEQPSNDWKPGQLLPIGDTIYRLTEIFEFANRLAIGPLAVDAMTVSIKLVGLKGRRLYIDNQNRSGFSFPRTAGIEEYPMTFSVLSPELVAKTRELALTAAEELFERFDWEPGHDMLAQWQNELFRR